MKDLSARNSDRWLLNSLTVWGAVVVGALMIIGAVSTQTDDTKKPTKAQISTAIVKRTEAAMIAVSAPTGLLGTKWSQSAAEVKSTRPNAVTSGAGKLSEAAIVFGRGANVVYSFGNHDMLTVITVVYADGSPASFKATRKKLTSSFGALPKPAPSDGYELLSRKQWPTTKWGSVELSHALMVASGKRVEIIGIYVAFDQQK